jgi:hypothetical protein
MKTNMTPTIVWFKDRPKSSSRYTVTDVSLVLRWFKSKLERKFLPRACLIGSMIATSGIMNPKTHPAQSETLESINVS